MGWSPLNIAKLPRILCGPILRRVDDGSVTVWIALHRKLAADDQKSVTLEVYARSNKALILSGTIKPIMIGNVYIAVVRAKGGSLLHSSYYLYKVKFGDDAIFGFEQAGAPLPEDEYTFQFIPKDLTKVRIAHASCRKPDGNGKDALLLLHSAGMSDPLQKPHLLLLTGDQIYADGVAAPLLLMILDAAKKLLADIYDADDDLESDSSPAYETFPLRRVPWLGSAKIFHSYRPDSHLVSFQEYFMMYMFAWSEVLWGDDIPVASQARAVLGMSADQDYTEEEAAQWNAQRELLSGFRESLPYVRKLLQTTSTLMIFDDHDVTDDWRLNPRWISNVLTTALGSRIELNALLAYMLNQAAGNDAEYFTPKINSIFVGSVINLWRTRSDGKGLGDILGWNASGKPNQKAIRFHYTIRYPAFHLVVLDTRTRRGYSSSPDTYPALIAEDMLPDQIGGSDEALPLILVSPAPVWGYALIEAIQQTLAEKWLLNEGLARSLVEYRSVQHISKLDPRLHRDAESWALESVARERLVGSIMKKWEASRFVVVLSGDVHYGFAATIDVPAPTEKRFIQLTSSAAHNEEGKASLGLINVKWGENAFTFDDSPRLRYATAVVYHRFDPSPPRKSFLSWFFPQTEASKPLEAPKLMPFNNCGLVSFSETTLYHRVYFQNLFGELATNNWTIPLSK